MGEVKAYRKKHWTGLDADLATIPNPALGDTYLATDKNKFYYWEGGAWKTGLGYEYVSRSVAAADWTQADFVLDSAFHVDALDASAIVPVGAIAVHFLVEAKDNAAGSVFAVRQNAINVYNTLTARTQIANLHISMFHTIVKCDADRLFDVLGTPAFDVVNLCVLGWFI